MKIRLGFIVKAKDSLIELLKSQSNSLHEYFSENYILTTEEHHYEVFEGNRLSILKATKNTFIRNTVFETLELSKHELEALFGKYESNQDLFDKWWTLEDADCDIIDTEWINK